MESHRRLKPDEEAGPPAADLGPGLGSLLPPDADDEDSTLSPAGRPDGFELSDRFGIPVETGEPGAAPPAASRPAGQTRDLNTVVHQILVIGLVISTALLLIGLTLGLLAGRALPSAVLPPAGALQRVLRLDPAGFISLGMLVLIFTPIVRVLGSMFVFLYERDWLYFGVTLIVFLVMLLSVIVGRV